MDMSFAVQAMSALYLVQNKDSAKTSNVIPVPREVDLEIARRKLHAWGIAIDELTEKQKNYLGSWNV